MRTKALLLTAAITAAGAATMQAQVYSANAVGYVNKSLPAGFCILANPLNGTNNQLNTILPLPDTADGTSIYRFKVATQNYADPIDFFAGFGWFTPDPDPNATVINPGEGFWIKPNGPTPLSVTFVGEVPQGNLSNPLSGNNNFNLVGSQVPQALPLGDTTTPNTLGFPAVEGDSVYVYDCAAQAYKAPYDYFNGFGWFSANVDDPGPQGPTIPVAEGFFVLKAGPLSQSWNRTFSVN